MSKRRKPDYTLEDAVLDRSGEIMGSPPEERFVCGIDEVGVGALAGPVMAAAVVLNRNFDWDGLNDSKELKPGQRVKFHDRIMETSLVGLGYATPETIDEIGISSARRRCFISAFEEIELALEEGATLFAVVDGRSLAWMRADLGGKASIFTDKADSKSLSVAAASVVAKVIRDHYMRGMNSHYPEYNFHNNKGYGVAHHIEVIKKQGGSPIHRRTFEPLKSYLAGVK